MPLRISKNRVALDGVPLNEGKSADVASAATIDIWSVIGNLVPITGTATISAFTAAPQAGAKRTLLCIGTPAFTHGANFLLPGSTNYTASAGDRIEVLAITTTQFRLSVLKASVLADVASGSLSNADQDFVALGTKTDGSAIADGVLYDPNGNVLSSLVASVNHRTDTLANLIGITGGAGEIAVATDRKALIRYNGAANGGRIFAANVFTYSAFAEAYNDPFAAATPTLLGFYFSIGATAADGDLVSTLTGLISYPPLENANSEITGTLRISGTVIFDAAASGHGTYRKIALEISTNSGSTWVLVQDFVTPPVANVAQQTSLGIQYQAAAITADAANTASYRYRLMASHDASGTIGVAVAYILVEFGRYNTVTP